MTDRPTDKLNYLLEAMLIGNDNIYQKFQPFSLNSSREIFVSNLPFIMDRQLDTGQTDGHFESLSSFAKKCCLCYLAVHYPSPFQAIIVIFTTVQRSFHVNCVVPYQKIKKKK